MYGFVQALIREVAYGTLAKRDRAPATWPPPASSNAGRGRAGRRARGPLHRRLAVRSGWPGGRRVAVQARLALVGAADRALNLGSPESAVGFLQQALLVTADPAERAPILERAGHAAGNAVQTDAAEAFLREAITLRREMGDTTAVFQSTACSPRRSSAAAGSRTPAAPRARRRRSGGCRGRCDLAALLSALGRVRFSQDRVSEGLDPGRPLPSRSPSTRS